MTNFISSTWIRDFHRLQYHLSDRNYGCRRRQRYLIFSQFSKYCCQNEFAFGALPRTPPGASCSAPSWHTLGFTIAEGPTELRAPGPRYPTIRHCQEVPSAFVRGVPDLEIYHTEYIFYRISPAVPRRT